MSDSARRSPWLLLIGFTVWTLAFCVMYAAHALGCWFGLHEIAFGPISVHRAVLIALFAFMLLVLGVLALQIRRAAREDARYRDARGQAREAAAAGDEVAQFLLRAGFVATIAALAATLFSFAPVLALSACV